MGDGVMGEGHGVVGGHGDHAALVHMLDQQIINRLDAIAVHLSEGFVQQP